MGGGGLLIFYVTNVSLLHVTLMKSLPLRLLNSLPLREGQGGSFRGSFILPHLSRTCSDKMGWREDMFKKIILMAHEWALIGESGKNKPPIKGDE